MRFSWSDASALFVLWLVQFLRPAWREEVAWLYLAWSAVLVVVYVARRREARALPAFVAIFRENRARRERRGA